MTVRLPGEGCQHRVGRRCCRPPRRFPFDIDGFLYSPFHTIGLLWPETICGPEVKPDKKTTHTAKQLPHDRTLSSRTKISPNHIYALSNVWLSTTFFTHSVSQMMIHLHIFPIQETHRVTGLWTKRWLNIKTWAFIKNRNSLDVNIKFTQEHVRGKRLLLLIVQHAEEERCLNIKGYGKLTPPPSRVQTSVIRTLHQRAESVPTRVEERANKQIKEAL